MKIIKDGIMDFIKQYGDTFEIFREENKITETMGLKNKDSSNNKFIGFMPEVDIKEGDVIINKLSGDKYYVAYQQMEVMNSENIQKKAYYLTELEYQQEKEKISTTEFKLNHLNRTTYTINEIKEFVEKEGKDEDKNELAELIKAIEVIIRYNISINKGVLSAHKDLLNRYPKLKEITAGIFLEWLTKKS